MKESSGEELRELLDKQIARLTDLLLEKNRLGRILFRAESVIDKVLKDIWYRVEGCSDPDCLVCKENRRVKRELERVRAEIQESRR